MAEEPLKPLASIRRIDIFAEWSRLTGLKKHRLSELDAKAWGIAVARMVNARTVPGHPPRQVNAWKKHAHLQDIEADWWKEVATPLEFDRKIVRRMGPEFYLRVFQPAIQQAWDKGDSYEKIQDPIREEWNLRLKFPAGPESH